VLDSCRDNPLAEDLKRRSASVQRGLARLDSPQGMIVAYATRAGRTADDGTGRNSSYTAAFLKQIETAEEIGTVFRRISADVYQATGQNQLPELSLSLIGEFYLHGRPAVLSATPDAAAQAWAAIKDTASPPVLEDFVRRYGDSIYGTLARARLEELKPQVAIVVPPVQPTKPPPLVQPAIVVPPPVVPGAPCGPSSTATVSLSARPACPLSVGEERALKPKDVFKECDECPEMVVVPAGSFTMGSPKSEPRSTYEDPQHQVTIRKAFAVGKFAATFDEWDACVADGGCNDYRPSDRGWGRGRQPVINVSWDDAKAYVAWLSRKTGKAYRLLSEAEREYATRAGKTTPFWWGSSITPRQANYDGTYVYNKGAKGENRQKILPVDAFEPNPWGLYQVHGNVWDWVEDCWHDSYQGAPADGTAWTTGDCSRRVLRGGSWYSNPWNLRAANRGRNSPVFRDSLDGFRLARTLTP
jgi:formylglycine-generating enzyme required for sulfatase activity